MDTLTLIAALILIAVFSVAGITKLTDRPGTRKAVREFGGPVFLAGLLALLLPLAELTVAVALLFPATRGPGAAGALGLLALFSGAIAVSLARGKRPDCHCFGQLHSAPASWKTLARNGFLGSIAAGLLVATRSASGPSLLGWLAARSATEIAVIAGVVVTVALVVALGAVLLSLTRSYGRVLLRLEATERALQDAGIELERSSDASMSELGLDPGTPAPPIELRLSSGEPVTRDGLLAPGLPLLLVFTSPGCGPCHDLLPAVARWQRQLSDRLTVAVASAGEPEAIRGQETEHGLAPMLLDADLSLSEAYLSTGTPSAVLIAPDGTIATYVAAGSDEIEALVDRVVTAPAEEGLPVGSPAPMLELRGIEGALEPLVDPLGKSTVLLFWNPGCGYCQSMLPALRAWEEDKDYSAPRLVIVSSGDTEETLEDGFRSTVVLDPEFEVGQAFAAGGTPMAVLVDANGTIASPLMAGGDAVLAHLAGARAGLERR
jgi:thiol-disulfide isomerase/thioredoxin